jgi:flagellar export protein FliJ
MNKLWSVLADKATRATRDAHAVVLEARQKVDKLAGSIAHVDRLRDDYVARFNAAQKEAHQIADNVAYRQFLDHLRGLRVKVQTQLSNAELQLAEARALFVQAQREQAKMEAMVERDARNVAQAKAKYEQKQIDAAGITQFNLR